MMGQIILSMAQAHLDRFGVTNGYTVEISDQLHIRVWKKGREGVFMTLFKPGKTQVFTIAMETFREVLLAQDMLLLASDFLRGLVGFCPEDIEPLNDDELFNGGA